MHHTFEHFGMEQRLGRAVEVGVYRIAQELLNNVVKHAGARNVQVQLLRNKGHLVLIVEDDGVGFDPAQNSNGVGMRSLMDRARILHGTLDIQRGATSGTIATLRVPLENGNRT
jgi:signal transduction histidine kinase